MRATTGLQLVAHRVGGTQEKAAKQVLKEHLAEALQQLELLQHVKITCDETWRSRRLCVRHGI